MTDKKVTMTELKGTRVAFVSLVNRSASRIPFRVLKSDKEHSMTINLSTIGRILKGEKPVTPAPTGTVITGVVTFDHGELAMPAVMLALKAEGFKVDAMTKNEDGTILFAQEDDALEGATIVKMSDELALVVKGFDPYCFGMTKDSSFSEQATALGFYGSLYNAADTLRSRVSDSMALATTKSEGAIAVKKSLVEYGQYVTAMVDAIPERAFKADKEVCAAITVAKMEKAKAKPAMTAEEIAAAEEASESAAEKAKEGKEEKTSKKVETTAETPAVEKSEIVAADPVVVAKSDMEKVLEAIAALSTTVGDVVKKVDSMAGEVKAVSDKQATTDGKVDDAIKKADTTANAVKNTILANPAANDQPAAGTVKKEENTDPRSGLFDTAFLGKRK
jgi:hypothetical protein